MKLMVLTEQNALNKNSIIKHSEIENQGWTWDHEQLTEDYDRAEAKMREYSMTLVEGNACQKIHRAIHFRSTASHFINYIDLIENRNGELWGLSLFSQGFQELLHGVIKKQGLKGSVIFLGNNSLVYPTLEILARYGFDDFVFLQLDEKKELVNPVAKTSAGLLKTKVSTVNSTAFIQSQKEYALCFVLEDNYPLQIIEDMSYFHFLSTQSLVIDLSGQSNFHFSEVKALGVDVIEYSVVQEQYAKHLSARVQTLKEVDETPG